MKTSPLALAIIGLIMFPAGIWGVFWVNNYLAGPSEEYKGEIVDVLPYVDTPKTKQTDSVINTQPLFGSGDTLLKAGDLSGAQAEYAKLVGTTKDVVEEGALMFRFALTKEDKVEAISLLKSLAANASNTEDLRSHAVEQMGWIYNHAKSDEERTAIASTIFEAQPYSTMHQNNNIESALLRLFEYASTIRPAPYANVMAGSYYLEKAKADTSPKTVDEETGEIMLNAYLVSAISKSASVRVLLSQIRSSIIPGYREEVQNKLEELDKAIAMLELE